jgi:hypothetical protein
VTSSTSARKRIALLIAVVGIGLIVERVTAYGGRDDATTAPAPAEIRTAREISTPETVPVVPVLRLDRLSARQVEPADDTQAKALFEPQSWQAAPVKVDTPPPPPRPVAPAFPYTYIGGLSEDGVRTGFFTHGERVLPVRSGDTIDMVYRVEQIDTVQMRLTYLPLKETMTVVFGGSQ